MPKCHFNDCTTPSFTLKTANLNLTNSVPNILP